MIPLSPDPAIEVCEVYRRLIRSWNDCQALRFSSLMTNDATLIGFDGTCVNGKDCIFTHLDQVFENHTPPRYISKIRMIRPLTPDIYFLEAVAGMVRDGHLDIDPHLNTIQTLILRREGSHWKVEHMQSTPAAFHGREEDQRTLTHELEMELSEKAIDESLTNQLMLW